LTEVRIKGLLEVRKCPHGKGVYSSRDLEAGELIWSFDHISLTTTPRSPPSKRWALIIGKTPDGENLFWDEASEEGGEYWSNFLDHSDHPNVKFLIETGNRTARLVTTRAVKAGEELFLDYKEYDLDNWAPG
jgi:hypothetical protein